MIFISYSHKIVEYYTIHWAVTTYQAVNRDCFKMQKLLLILLLNIIIRGTYGLKNKINRYTNNTNLQTVISNGFVSIIYYL